MVFFELLEIMSAFSKLEYLQDNSKPYEYRRPVFATLLKIFDTSKDSTLSATDQSIAVINSVISIGRHLAVIQIVHVQTIPQNLLPELTCLFGLIRTFCSFDPLSNKEALNVLTDYLENAIEHYDSNLLVLVLNFAWIAESEKAFRHINGYRIWVQLNLHSFLGLSRWRAIVNDYVTLLKTRLLDMGAPLADYFHHLKESIQLNKNSVTPQPALTQGSRMLSIGKILTSFSLSSRIPQALLESIVFRNRWYLNTFLPELMYGEPLEEEISESIPSTTRASLIENLYKNGKIGKKQYDSFLESNRQKKLELAQAARNRNPGQPSDSKSPILIDLDSPEKSPNRSPIPIKPDVSQEALFKTIERLVEALLGSIEDSSDHNLERLKLDEKISEIKTAIASLLDITLNDESHTTKQASLEHMTDCLIYDYRSHEIYQNPRKLLDLCKTSNSLTTLLMNVIQLFLQDIQHKQARKSISIQCFISFLDILRTFKSLHPNVYLNLYQSLYSNSTAFSTDECLIIALICLILDAWQPAGHNGRSSGFVHITALDHRTNYSHPKPISYDPFNRISPLKALFDLFIYGNLPTSFHSPTLLMVLCYVITIGFGVFNNQSQENLELLIHSLESGNLWCEHLGATIDKTYKQNEGLVPKEFVWKVAFELEKMKSYDNVELLPNQQLSQEITQLLPRLPKIYRHSDLTSWITWTLTQKPNDQEHLRNMITTRFYQQFSKPFVITENGPGTAVQRLGVGILTYILRKELARALNAQSSETLRSLQRIIEIAVNDTPLEYNSTIQLLKDLLMSQPERHLNPQMECTAAQELTKWARECLIAELQSIDTGNDFYGYQVTSDKNKQFWSIYLETFQTHLNLSFSDLIIEGLDSQHPTKQQIQETSVWVEMCFSMNKVMNDPAWTKPIQLQLKEQFYSRCPTFLLALGECSNTDLVCCRTHNITVSHAIKQLQTSVSSIISGTWCEGQPSSAAQPDPYSLACAVHNHIEDILNSAISEEGDQAARIHTSNRLYYVEKKKNEDFVCILYEKCVWKIIQLLSEDFVRLGTTLASLIFGDTTFADLTTFKLTFYKELVLGILCTQPQVLQTLSFEWHSKHSPRSKTLTTTGLSWCLYLQLTLILTSKLERDFGPFEPKYVARYYFINVLPAYLNFQQHLFSASALYYYPLVINNAVRRMIERWNSSLLPLASKNPEEIALDPLSHESTKTLITSLWALDPTIGTQIKQLWVHLNLKPRCTGTPVNHLKRKAPLVIEID
ncbi:hypothetical protein K493DRAFT_377823 [Basidiobolus meristosporus CBS 931.73]|uniref:Fanconi anaemia group A protein helical domain-containing protein n=1 Tax=Basidiobolus meristosporus CBS 931.73 TaxID=1314790 RepID=A0A1Y1ZEB9_9FUNG|nr:hypothetical protein K493DRAFT_377823 [Basidiobolus meristosporus CBS 931.73]|eukprot:ORY08175.1 hypothetical protein K493DRAFT_377823 [Basidiobolus meristosporus CBS 931.73]